MAVCAARAVGMEPADDHVLLTELYNSAVCTYAMLAPPAISTLPSLSRVAVCLSRDVAMEPAEVHWLAIGSYNTAFDVVLPLLSPPPATSTMPFANTVAV